MSVRSRSVCTSLQSSSGLPVWNHSLHVEVKLLLKLSTSYRVLQEIRFEVLRLWKPGKSHKVCIVRSNRGHAAWGYSRQSREIRRQNILLEISRLFGHRLPVLPQPSDVPDVFISRISWLIMSVFSALIPLSVLRDSRLYHVSQLGTSVALTRQMPKCTPSLCAIYTVIQIPERLSACHMGPGYGCEREILALDLLRLPCQALCLPPSLRCATVGEMKAVYIPLLSTHFPPRTSTVSK